MGRFLIGLGLLLALLGIGLYSAWAMTEVHTPIAEKLEQAAETADQIQATALLQSAQAAWDHHWHSTAVLAEHAPMDEIDSLFAQADAYAKAGQMGDFSALCMRLSQRIRAAAESHRPTWWNFL